MMSRPQPLSSEFDPGAFSHLREFLRGYFHQDWPDEYASITEAVEHFWMDSGTASVAQVAHEWQNLQQMAGGSLETTVEWLDELGGAWNPAGQKELDEMAHALAKFKDRSRRK